LKYDKLENYICAFIWKRDCDEEFDSEGGKKFRTMGEVQGKKINFNVIIKIIFNSRLILTKPT
jgi:hypothetical protein